MKKASFFLPLLLCLVSCTSNSEVTNTVAEEETTVVPTPTDVPAPSTDVPPTQTPASPTDNQKDTSTSRSPQPEKAETMCFQNEEKRTISTVMISISGSKVSGTYDWQPFEKDARRGMLSGTIQPAGTERKIKATWTYQQEGMKQELPFEALLMPDGIRQKAYRFDTQTGMEVLESGNNYSIVYKKVACQ